MPATWMILRAPPLALRRSSAVPIIISVTARVDTHDVVAGEREPTTTSPSPSWPRSSPPVARPLLAGWLGAGAEEPAPPPLRDPQSRGRTGGAAAPQRSDCTRTHFRLLSASGGKPHKAPSRAAAARPGSGRHHPPAMGRLVDVHIRRSRDQGRGGSRGAPADTDHGEGHGATSRAPTRSWASSRPASSAGVRARAPTLSISDGGSCYFTRRRRFAGRPGSRWNQHQAFLNASASRGSPPEASSTRS